MKTVKDGSTVSEDVKKSGAQLHIDLYIIRIYSSTNVYWFSPLTFLTPILYSNYFPQIRMMARVENQIKKTTVVCLFCILCRMLFIPFWPSRGAGPRCSKVTTTETNARPLVLTDVKGEPGTRVFTIIAPAKLVIIQLFYLCDTNIICQICFLTWMAPLVGSQRHHQNQIYLVVCEIFWSLGCSMFHDVLTDEEPLALTQKNNMIYIYQITSYHITPYPHH